MAPERRNFVGKIWIIGSVLYDVVRAVIVTLLFSKHGINGWVYFAYEMTFAVVFGIASFRLTVALVDHQVNKVRLYGLLTFLTFFAPDAYIVIAGYGIPTSTYILLGLYLAVSTSVALVELFNKVRRKRGRPKKSMLDIVDIDL